MVSNLLSYVVEIFAVLMAAAGLSFAGFYKKIDHLHRNRSVKIGYKIIGAVLIPLLATITAKSLAKEYFDVDVDLRICRYVNACKVIAKPQVAPAPQLAVPEIAEQKLSDLPSYQLCKLAINGSHDGWSKDFEWKRHVDEAKRRDMDVNGCLRRLGLATIEENATIEERKRIAGLSMPDLCRQALDAATEAWNYEKSVYMQVSEAFSRRYSVDDCRNSLGLLNLAKQKEIDRVSALDNLALCREALNSSGTIWSDALEKNESVAEARRRYLSVDDCRGILGLQTDTYSSNDNNSPDGGFSNSPDGGLSSEPKAPSVNFAVGSIANPKYHYVNLRANPGNKSRVVGKLPNGTEVVLLGLRTSPSSGHPYCRVLAGSGLQGYVDFELVAGDCQLNYEQEAELSNIDRRKQAETIKAFGDLAVTLFGAIARN